MEKTLKKFQVQITRPSKHYDYREAAAEDVDPWVGRLLCMYSLAGIVGRRPSRMPLNALLTFESCRKAEADVALGEDNRWNEWAAFLPLDGWREPVGLYAELETQVQKLLGRRPPKRGRRYYFKVSMKVLRSNKLLS